MKGTLLLAVAVLGAALLAGCVDDTSRSTQPSQTEIEAGVNRRLAEIDKNPALSPEQKERMKQQITGRAPTQSDTRQNVAPK